MLNKKVLFTEAHKMAKTFEGNYRACFALALKIIRRGESKKMAIIETRTGSEWHSTFSSKGFVFVIENGKESFINESFKAISQEWDTDRHTKQVESEYELPAGTILKFFSSGFNGNTRRDMKKVVDERFFIVSDDSDMNIYPSYSHYDSYFLKGGLKEITKEEALR